METWVWVVIGLAVLYIAVEVARSLWRRRNVQRPTVTNAAGASEPVAPPQTRTFDEQMQEAREVENRMTRVVGEMPEIPGPELEIRREDVERILEFGRLVAQAAEDAMRDRLLAATYERIAVQGAELLPRIQGDWTQAAWSLQRAFRALGEKPPLMRSERNLIQAMTGLQEQIDRANAMGM